MKYLFALIVGVMAIAGVIALRAAPQTGSDARAREVIQTLHLTVLPKESGYLGIIGRSEQMVNVDGRALAVQSQNYYMLTRERPINYLHWLVPEDTHILIEGGPVDYFIFHPDGRAEKVTLGLDIAAGQRPVVAVPSGCWKALRLHDHVGYALMVNTLSPEFTSDRAMNRRGCGLGETLRELRVMGDSKSTTRTDWSELDRNSPTLAGDQRASTRQRGPLCLSPFDPGTTGSTARQGALLDPAGGCFGARFAPMASSLAKRKIGERTHHDFHRP